MIFTDISTLYQTQEGKTPLRGKEMASVPSIKHAFLHVIDGKIVDFGAMQSCPRPNVGEEVISLENKHSICPGLIDSHTHLVFGQFREKEFEQKIQGLSYTEIANNGGGILESARKLGKLSTDDLVQKARPLLEEAIALGTTALEIKSGYGLYWEQEKKILEAIGILKKEYPLLIKATYLGAHAKPKEYKDAHSYLDAEVFPYLETLAQTGAADFIDMFCEHGYFSANHLEALAERCKIYDLPLKIHANQFQSIGGVDVAHRHGAISVDHLEEMTSPDFDILSSSPTIATVLPACSLFIRIPYAPARKMIDKGIALAVATDFNPGSSPCLSMPMAMGLACSQMRISPQEVFHAATINAANALQIEHETGSISIGKRADILILKEGREIEHIPYLFGSSCIHSVYIAGILQKN